MERGTVIIDKLLVEAEACGRNSGQIDNTKRVDGVAVGVLTATCHYRSRCEGLWKCHRRTCLLAWCIVSSILNLGYSEPTQIQVANINAASIQIVCI